MRTKGFYHFSFKKSAFNVFFLRRSCRNRTASLAIFSKELLPRIISLYIGLRVAIAASRFPEPQSQHLQTQASSIRQLIPLVHIAANANGTAGGKGLVDLTAGGGSAVVDQAVNMPTGSPVLLVTQLNADV